MTRRVIPGIGAADYTDAEERLARDLIEMGAHGEVATIHALKVYLDARPIDGPERRHVAVGFDDRRNTSRTFPVPHGAAKDYLRDQETML